MKGPELYADIGKKARDLLTRDYTCDQKLAISTSSFVGVGLTSSAVKKGGLYVFDIASQYKHKNAVVDLKVDTDSNISCVFNILDVMPSTKAITTIKFPDYSSGKFELQYFHDHATLAASVGLKQSPIVDISTTVGSQGVTFGLEAGFDTASGNFTKYNVGIGLSPKPNSNIAINVADKGDTIKGSYMMYWDEKQKNALVAEVTRRISTNETSLTVGGAYSVDPSTTVKAKLNNSGKLGALLQHEVKPKSLLTISGEFDTRALDKTPKFGLAVALNP